MAKTITITNGTGSADVVNGSYIVTAEVPGYDNASISPANVEVVNGTNTYAFTISATGSLTLHVTEDSTSSGTPIEGAVFVRTDASGTEYGSEITTDATGNTVFENVPFSHTGAPTIYFKQTASDGNHEFDNSVQSTTMQENTQTLEITNALGELRTINLTDANYENLPVDSGSITLA